MPTSSKSHFDLQALKTYLMLSRDIDIKNTSTYARVRIIINFQSQSFLFYLTDKRLIADNLLKAVWEVIQDPKDTVCRNKGVITKPAKEEEEVTDA